MVEDQQIVDYVAVATFEGAAGMEKTAIQIGSILKIKPVICSQSDLEARLPLHTRTILFGSKGPPYTRLSIYLARCAFPHDGARAVAALEEALFQQQNMDYGFCRVICEPPYFFPTD